MRTSVTTLLSEEARYSGIRAGKGRLQVLFQAKTYKDSLAPIGIYSHLFIPSGLHDRFRSVNPA